MVSMKKLQTMGLVGIVAIAVGIVGISNVSASEFGLADSPKTTTEAKSNMLGHVTLTLKDPSGNIIAYRQSDNLVVNQGHNCAPITLFGATNPSNACNSGGTTPGLFNVIALSASGTAIAANGNYSAISALSGNGLTAGAATSDTVTSFATGSGPTGNAVATLSKTFTYTGSSQAVGMAALIDGATTPNVFASHAFSSSVTLGTNDQLTVQWQITLT